MAKETKTKRKAIELTPALINELANNYQFLQVNDGPKLSSAKKSIGGAKRVFAKGTDVVYNLQHRVTGTRANVDAFLTNKGLGGLEYNVDARNFLTSQGYLEEAEAKKRMKKVPARPRGSAPEYDYTLAQLEAIGQLLKEKAYFWRNDEGKEIVNKSEASKGKKATGKKKGGSKVGVAKSVADKLADAKANSKIVIVSKLVDSTGKGSRVRPQYTESGKAKAVSLPEYPLIYSDNVAAYNVAIDSLVLAGELQAAVADNYKSRFAALLASKGTSSKSPKTKSKKTAKVPSRGTVSLKKAASPVRSVASPARSSRAASPVARTVSPVRAPVVSAPRSPSPARATSPVRAAGRVIGRPSGRALQLGKVPGQV